MQLHEKIFSFLFPDDKKLIIYSIITAIITTTSGYLIMLNPPFLTRRKLAYVILAFIFIYCLSIFCFRNFIIPKISLLNKQKRTKLLIFIIFLSSLVTYLVDGLDFSKNLNWIPKHSVVITANVRDEKTNNRNFVKLIGVNYSDDLSLSFSNLILSNGWQRDDTGLYTCERGASITWESHPNERIVFFFEESPGAGNITLSVDGQTDEIDLYAEDTSIKAINKKFNPPVYIEVLSFFIKWLFFFTVCGIIILIYVEPRMVQDINYVGENQRFGVLAKNKIDTFKLFFINNRSILIAILVLVFIGLITYGKGMFSSFIVGDEYGRIKRSLTGNLPCPMPNNLFLRPLTGCYFKFLDFALGTNPSLYRTMSLMLTIIASIFLFFLLNTVLKGKTLFSLLVSLIFLVFPTTTVHSYFETGYHKISAILFFFSLRKLYQANIYHEFKNYPKNSLLYILSIFIYESNFGLSFIFPFVMCVFAIKQKNREKFLYNAGLLSGLILFSIGRLVTQVNHPGFFGHTVNAQMFSIDTLIRRFLSGITLNLITVWSDALIYIVQSDNLLLLLFIVLICLFLSFIAFNLILNKTGIVGIQKTIEHIPHNFFEIAIIATSGIIITVIGFFPIILGFDPGFDEWRHTRIHYWPSFGSAIVWVSVMGFLFKIFKNKKYAFYAYLTAISLLLSISMVKQISILNKLNEDWEEKKLLFAQLFDLAPNFRPDTNVIFIYDNETFKFNTKLEIELSVYYQTSSVNGYTIYKQTSKIETTSDGFIIDSNVIPFDRTVVFEFAKGNLRNIKNFNGHELCIDCITNEQIPELQFCRSLLLN